MTMSELIAVVKLVSKIKETHRKAIWHQTLQCMYRCSLKLLGLYLYTLIIGHTYYNILSILNNINIAKKIAKLCHK